MFPCFGVEGGSPDTIKKQILTVSYPRLILGAAATAQGFRLLAGETIDAVTTPITGGITTTPTDSFLEMPATGVARFFRLAFP